MSKSKQGYVKRLYQFIKNGIKDVAADVINEARTNAEIKHDIQLPKLNSVVKDSIEDVSKQNPGFKLSKGELKKLIRDAKNEVIHAYDNADENLKRALSGISEFEADLDDMEQYGLEGEYEEIIDFSDDESNKDDGSVTAVAIKVEPTPELDKSAVIGLCLIYLFNLTAHIELRNFVMSNKDQIRELLSSNAIDGDLPANEKSSPIYRPDKVTQSFDEVMNVVETMKNDATTINTEKGPVLTIGIEQIDNYPKDIISPDACMKEINDLLNSINDSILQDPVKEATYASFYFYMDKIIAFYNNSLSGDKQPLDVIDVLYDNETSRRLADIVGLTKSMAIHLTISTYLSLISMEYTDKMKEIINKFKTVN